VLSDSVDYAVYNTCFQIFDQLLLSCRWLHKRLKSMLKRDGLTSLLDFGLPLEYLWHAVWLYGEHRYRLVWI